MKPFLIHVGGKADLIKDIFYTFPNTIDTYYEPFIGGGSVLFYILELLEQNKLNINHIKVNDKNKILIEVYKNIKNNLSLFISTLEKLSKIYWNSEDKKATYYILKNKYNTTDNIFFKSALYIVLNKTCYRGMYRESKNGFNTAYGNYANRKIYDEEQLKEASYLFNKYKVEFNNQDFSEFIKDVKSSDFIYLDPPYHNTTTKYTHDGFNEDCQIQLYNIVKSLPCRFSLSNSNTEFINQLYQNYHIDIINAKRRIKAKDPNYIEQEIIIYK